MKTNKSYTKRLRLTPSGKLLARQPGQNHFNAKASRRKQLNKKRTTEFNNPKAIIAQYIPYK